MLPQNAADAWRTWRAKQPEADERDIDAASAFGAGYATGHEAGRKTWHESLAPVLVVALIAASICYWLSTFAR